MAVFKIKPIDHLVARYWQEMKDVIRDYVEGLPSNPLAGLRREELRRKAASTGHNLEHQTVLQVQADSDGNDEVSTFHDAE